MRTSTSRLLATIAATGGLAMRWVSHKSQSPFTQQPFLGGTGVGYVRLRCVHLSARSLAHSAGTIRRAASTGKPIAEKVRPGMQPMRPKVLPAVRSAGSKPPRVITTEDMAKDPRLASIFSGAARDGVETPVDLDLEKVESLLAAGTLDQLLEQDPPIRGRLTGEAAAKLLEAGHGAVISDFFGTIGGDAMRVYLEHDAGAGGKGLEMLRNFPGAFDKEAIDVLFSKGHGLLDRQHVMERFRGMHELAGKK